MVPALRHGLVRKIFTQTIEFGNSYRSSHRFFFAPTRGLAHGSLRRPGPNSLPSPTLFALFFWCRPRPPAGQEWGYSSTPQKGRPVSSAEASLTSTNRQGQPATRSKYHIRERMASGYGLRRDSRSLFVTDPSASRAACSVCGLAVHFRKCNFVGSRATF